MVSTRARRFGLHVRGLRRVRGLTQEQLAERAELAADTIRRLEHGSFSPSLKSLDKLTSALRVTLGTLFLGFEQCECDHASEGDSKTSELCPHDHARELANCAQSLTRAEQTMALRILTALSELLAAAVAEDDG